MTPVRFTVPGRAVPQGSKRQSRHGHMYEQAAARLRPWRGAIVGHALAAQVAAHWPRAFAEPVDVAIAVTFARPGRPAHVFPGKSYGDVDKLARACLDAMTGVLFADDTQVTSLVVTKAYGPSDYVEITVSAARPALGHQPDLTEGSTQ